jgi:hypothetical protein
LEIIFVWQIAREDQMLERRRCPRRQVLKSGLIVRRSGNGPTIECAIRNISDLGACLQISVAYDLSMDLILVMGGSRRSIRVVWRTKDRTGIAYA